jgi:5,10-methylenetetrahydrofolate reductase
MCRDLIARGIKGFHFYTLNLENSVLSVLSSLGVVESSASRR